jgi:hypothetical protein
MGHVGRRAKPWRFAVPTTAAAHAATTVVHSPRQSQASQRAALCIGALGGTCTDDTVARERQQRAPQPARRRALVARGDLGAVLRARAHHVGAEGPAVRRARAIAAQRYEAIGADEIRRKVQRLQLCSPVGRPNVEWQRWHAHVRIHSRAGADGCAANVGAGGEGRAAHVSHMCRTRVASTVGHVSRSRACAAVTADDGGDEVRDGRVRQAAACSMLQRRAT